MTVTLTLMELVPLLGLVFVLGSFAASVYIHWALDTGRRTIRRGVWPGSTSKK